jgi:hypothetical protein
MHKYGIFGRFSELLHLNANKVNNNVAKYESRFASLSFMLNAKCEHTKIMMIGIKIFTQ